MLRILTFLLVSASFSTLIAQTGQIQSAAGLDELRFGAELRFRSEMYNPVSPLTDLASDTVSAGRARLYLAADIEDHLSAFIEFQGQATGSGSESESSLHQGWGRLNDLAGKGSLQFGRFEMDYGNGRMVSSLDWSNTGRAWDGLRVRTELERYDFDAFWTRPVAGQGAPLDGRDSFGGLYMTMKELPFDMDLYAFSRSEDPTTINRARDFTYGALFAGELNPTMTWSLEAAYQTGEHGADDASAHALAFRFDVATGPEVSFGFGYELASGDNNSLDENAKEFVPLYDSGDVWHGPMDLLVWTNLQDFVLRSRVGLNSAWAFHAELHQFIMAADGTANSPFRDSANIPLNGDGDIGSEIDLYVMGALSDYVHFQAGVSEFFAGDAVVKGDDQMWAYAQLVLRF